MSDSKLTVGELVYKISGDMENLQTELKRSEAEIKKLQSAMEQNNTVAQKSQDTFKKVGTAVKTFVAAFAVDKVLSFGRASVEQARALIEQQTKLAQVLRVSQNATDDEIQSMFDYAESLEKVGIINKDSILAAEAQLATYDLSTDSIKTLTPALLDYLAAEKGSNATTEDAISITNGLAQAIQGNYSSLSRTGFILDEETKKTIENGTQKERVAAITEVLNSTYKDYNKTLLEQNPQVAATRAIDDFREKIGLALIPAIDTVSKELLLMSGSFATSGINVQSWGKAFYRVAQGIVVVAKIFKEAFLGIAVAWNGVQNIFIGGAIAIVKGFQIAANAMGKNTEVFDIALADLKDSFKQNLDDISNAGEESTKNMDSMVNNLKEIWSADGFQAVVAKASTAFKEGKNAIDDFGGSTSDAAKESDKFKEKLLGVLDSLKETSKTLNGDVAKAFKDFNDEFGKALNDENDKLVQSTLDAQDKIKDLNKQILDEQKKLKEEIGKLNLDNPKDRDDKIHDAKIESKKVVEDLKNQIAEEQKVLDSRKGYEERQTEFIAGLRQKLTDAGIDAEKEGLTSLLNVKSLEDKIKDERALRDMDDFAREEELQKRRLVTIVDNLIVEITALRDKIEQQKNLESDLTLFLSVQDTLRKESVDTFANYAINKYKEIANQLRTAVSLQNQLNAVKTSSGLPQFAIGGFVGTKGGEVHPGEYVIPADLVSRFSGIVSAIEQSRSGGGVTNNRNINAPITINSNPQDGLDFRTVGRELAWELGNR